MSQHQGCGNTSSYKNDLTNQIGSYSSYIARKVAIQNLKRAMK